MTIKWGIIGCGSISTAFAECLLQTPGAELTAVASRTPGKAERFAGQFNVGKFYADYVQLAQDETVDVVYIGTTHNFHFDHTLLCLKNRKHVVCEKPLSLNANFSKEMIATARENNRFLMEAVWTRFLPAIIKLQETLEQKVIGDVCTVNADFSIIREFDPNHRLYNPELGGGSLLDLGIYPLTFAQLIYNDFPETVASEAVIGQSGVDETASMLLRFKGDRTAVLSSSCRSCSPHLGIIVGRKGYITVPDFYHPHQFTIHKPQAFTIKSEGIHEETIAAPYDALGYGHEAQEVMRCLQSGLLESPLMPWETSLGMMRLMDTLRRQWGLRYPAESDQSRS